MFNSAVFRGMVFQFETAGLTFSVTQGHWYCCHSIGHIISS